MARRAEARTPMVAGADLWLAEAAIPCRPRRAGISRSDLSESLYSDTRRAEEAADGAPAYSAADAPSQRRHHEERTGTDRRYGLDPRAAGRGRGARRARLLGRRPFSPDRTTRTSRRSSSAIPILPIFPDQVDALGLLQHYSTESGHPFSTSPMSGMCLPAADVTRSPRLRWRAILAEIQFRAS